MFRDRGRERERPPPVRPEDLFFPCQPMGIALRRRCRQGLPAVSAPTPPVTAVCSARGRLQSVPRLPRSAPSVPPGAACSGNRRHVPVSLRGSGSDRSAGSPQPWCPPFLSFPLHAIPFPCLPFPDLQPVPVSRHSPFPVQIPGKSQNPAAAEGGIFSGHARCHIIVAVTPAAFPPRSACQRRNIRCSFFPPSFPSKT